MNLLLVPIGIESKTGGQYAPILDNKEFVYIPIPSNLSTEDPDFKKQIACLNFFHKKTQHNTYDLKPYTRIPIDPKPNNINKVYMGDLLSDAQYNGYRLKSYVPHYDPEFKTYTYGEGSDNKAKTLSKLKEDDMIVFYMSLCPKFHNKPKGKFIVGYFTIETIFDYRFKNIRLNYYEVDDRIKNNMHIKQADSEPVIAKGKPSESRLFRHALQFTDSEEWKILPSILNKIEWTFPTKKVLRGTRKLKGEAAEKFRALLISHN